MNHVLIIKSSEKGVALLLVLWIVALLSIICTEFSWTMRTETATVTNFKEGEQAYYTAEAGINRAIVELMKTARSLRRTEDDEDFDERSGLDSEESEMQYWEPGSGPYAFDFADAKCEVMIEDEDNKIGLNPFLKKAKNNPTLLKALLADKIGLEGEQRDIVADSLIDWYDKDHNITGINGAEDDYYESLDPPYNCRDDDIPVIEELLLVRGVDEEVYYGVKGKPEQKIRLTAEELEKILSGELLEDEAAEQEQIQAEGEEEENQDLKINLGLANIFSVFSQSSSFKPNINTASLDQLLLLEGIDEATAREIVKARRERKFESVTDRLPQFKNYEVWVKNITVKSARTTRYLTIRARGFSPDGRIARKVSCNVMLTRSRCVIMNWKAIN